MEMHEIVLTHTNLRIVNRDRNGRIGCETTSGLPVFIHNPRYEVPDLESGTVVVPIDDALADELRENGSGWYATPDRAYEFLIVLSR